MPYGQALNMRIFFLSIFCLFYLIAPSQSAADLIAKSDVVYSRNPDSSLVLCQKALEVALAQSDSANIAYANAKCARYHILKSDFESATACLNTAIGIQQRIGEQNGLAYSYKLKAIMQKRIGNTADALQLQQEAVRLYKEAGNTAGMSSVLMNLTLDYIESKQYDQAEASLDTIAAYPETMEGSAAYFYWQNRGTLQAARDDHKAALVYFDTAKTIALEYELVDSYVTLLSLIATSEMRLGNFDAAEKALLESCDLARKNNLDHELNESLMVLTRLYVSRGDYKNAYLSNKEQTDLAQKIYNIDRINKINELEKKLELVEKEKTIAEQNKQIAEDEAERKELEQRNFLLVIVVSAVVLIAGLVFFVLVRTRRLNKQIASQNVLIEDAYGKIRDSITYSRKIQKAMLPTNETISSYFPHSFVLYEPRDIVSGDFYWFHKHGDEILFAAADCTGHGVPGAFLSIVGYNNIHQAVNIHNVTSP